MFAVLAKCNEWTEIESFAQKKEKWLKKYLELPNGIPSHDTIQRVISILNPNTLYSDTINYLINKINLITSKEHNGIITREYCMTDDINWMNKKAKWPGLKSIGLARNTIERNGKTIIEDRFYIISFFNDIELFSKSVRLEWGVENNLHAPLDIIFKEDDNKILEKNVAKNLGIIRRIALALALLKFVQTYYKKSLNIIRTNIAFDFENEIENIFRLLDVSKISKLKNT